MYILWYKKMLSPPLLKKVLNQPSWISSICCEIGVYRSYTLEILVKMEWVVLDISSIKGQKNPFSFKLTVRVISQCSESIENSPNVLHLLKLFGFVYYVLSLSSNSGWRLYSSCGKCTRATRMYLNCHCAEITCVTMLG